MSRKLAEHRNRIIYPLSVTQLDQRDLISIIEILLIDSDRDRAKAVYLGQYRSHRTSKAIRAGIQNLRWQLQANALFRLLFGPSKIVLCEVHRGFNPWIIHNLFKLLVKEVTAFLDELYWFLEYLEDDVKKMLRALMSIAGMWWCPKGRHDLPPFHARYYQENRCEACMLARVVSKGSDLQNLRATLLSRTKEDDSEEHPMLKEFIDAAISTTELSPGMLQRSMELAAGARAARKAARNFARKQMKGPRPMHAKGKRKRSHCITIQLKADTPEEAKKERREILAVLGRLKGEPSKDLDTLANGMVKGFECGVEGTVNGEDEDENLPDYTDNEQVPMPAPSYHSQLDHLGSHNPRFSATSLRTSNYRPPSVKTEPSSPDQASEIRSPLGDDELMRPVIIEEARKSSDELPTEAKSNGSAISPLEQTPVKGSRLPQNLFRFRMGA
ncbi:hypothetical protein ASPBRDRAFT_118557 [Aspergillus brasiliensis CBS 101740]|uniref:Uncharacterized protein n=1 Tax=Aspergillus brasiliensis (strain CBS 101740 / IMI 381727 / IBT 21946) TaxID=767769 RepID=A0A1L9US38_ASPBC|nr:hypothetical protein ASPBRDRAFT_118557 [Aspergillus brasiliensis CBS 101740]